MWRCQLWCFLKNAAVQPVITLYHGAKLTLFVLEDSIYTLYKHYDEPYTI